MNIHIIVVAHSLVNELRELVNATATNDVTYHIFLHSEKTDVMVMCENLRNSHPRGQIRYYPYGTNRGLATSWNEGIMNALLSNADVIMIANDDVVATSRDMYKIAVAAESHPEFGFIEGIGFDKRMDRRQNMNFALCAINRIAIDTIGYFDQNFFPIYFEDSDLVRRAALAGVQFFNVGETEIVHGSMVTTHADPLLLAKHAENFSANEAYYVQKWGGRPGSESFSIPFDNPSFNLKISGKDVFSPYPKYNRIGRGAID